MKGINISRILIAAGLVLSAETAMAKVMDETVATVNGEPILASEYKKNVDLITADYKQAMPEFFDQAGAQEQLDKKVLDQMIDDLLVYQQAVKSKKTVTDREIQSGIQEVKKRFAVDEAGKPLSEKEAEAAFAKELARQGYSTEQFRERIRRQLLVRKMVDEAVRPNVKPPDEKEVQKLFDNIKFIIKGDTAPLKGLGADDAAEMTTIAQRLNDMTAERVRVRHILLKTDPSMSIVDKNKVLDRASAIKKELDGGADFADTAKKYSQDTESAKRGGDIGFVIKGWMPPEFDKKAFSLPVGDISDPFETKFGYHIIRIEEKRAAQSIIFDDVKDDLAQYLASKSMQKELLKFIAELRKKATVTVTPAAKSAK